MAIAVKEQTVISVSIKLSKVIGNLWPQCGLIDAVTDHASAIDFYFSFILISFELILVLKFSIYSLRTN